MDEYLGHGIEVCLSTVTKDIVFATVEAAIITAQMQNIRCPIHLDAQFLGSTDRGWPGRGLKIESLDFRELSQFKAPIM